jgi:hypothetical protein
MNTTKARSAPRELHRDARGAVLVEFLVAVMPLMITFFSFLQIAQIAQARLVMKHATIVGARAAAVMSNKNKNTPDMGEGSSEKSDETITNAVRLGLGPWDSTINNLKVKVDDHSNCESEGVFDDVEVTVTGDYKCSVPFGGFLVCGMHGGTHSFKQSYAFPHQGARYKDLGGADCPEE